MMDIETIIHLNKQAGKKAKANHDEPKFFSHDEINELEEGNIRPIRSIPNLGDHIPDGWKQFNVNNLKDKLSVPEWWYGCKILKGGELWCDSSGLGAEDEPALTVNQLVSVVSKLLKENSHLGFALYSTGQFQAGVRVYEPQI